MKTKLGKTVGAVVNFNVGNFTPAPTATASPTSAPTVASTPTPIPRISDVLNNLLQLLWKF